ncbi:MAG: disulfide bond formation protein B [Hyphomicrobium sp.]|nr:disulfide bond formation protein B [Hyphomicrobium sp.]PPC82767.1 MAG: disulfide bond formation protein B [Hyphomicrobium sp.]
MLDTNKSVTSAAYSWGGSTLFLAVFAILTALGIQYIGGIAPCALCLEQRTAYYIAIPLLFLALVLVSADRGRLAGLLFFAVALAFLMNAGLGVYHAGAEWKFWPGPDTCGATAQSITGTAGNLLEKLDKARVVRCDEPALVIFGLSLAGWNVVASLTLFIASLKAAFLSPERNQ